MSLRKSEYEIDKTQASKSEIEAEKPSSDLVVTLKDVSLSASKKSEKAAVTAKKSEKAAITKKSTKAPKKSTKASNKKSTEGAKETKSSEPTEKDKLLSNEKDKKSSDRKRLIHVEKELTRKERIVKNFHAFRKFMYNSEDGTVMGRNGKSWLQLTIFYIVLYFLLAVFFAACLFLYLLTLDKTTPRFYGPGNLVGEFPGVSYQPWDVEHPISNKIIFNPKDEKSYKVYVDILDTYLKKHNEKSNNTRICGQNESNNATLKGSNSSKELKACRYETKFLEDAGCLNKTSYGYRDGEPCVFLSVNRLIGWMPNGNITFRCYSGTELSDSKNSEDGHIAYKVYPEYVETKYWPYSYVFQPNYHQPFVAVKFFNLPKNKDVNVKCVASIPVPMDKDKKLDYDNENNIGLMHFVLHLKE